MDINEVPKDMKSRHPWELSRTKCILKSMEKYLTASRAGLGRKYLNIGAGDMYYDYALMEKYDKDRLYAVDIGYSNKDSDNNKIQKFNYLEEIQENNFDYALMMDSLEYMDDDVAYLKKLCNKLKPGSYIFFTLPSFQKLFSQHDIIVKQLRRYDMKSFSKVINEIPQIEIVEKHYFYFSLLCIRYLQKCLHLSIDPKHKVTTGWKFNEQSLITRLVTGVLNLDFKLGHFLSKHGICVPGLSLFVVCRKE